MTTIRGESPVVNGEVIITPTSMCWRRICGKGIRVIQEVNTLDIGEQDNGGKRGIDMKPMLNEKSSSPLMNYKK